MLFKYPPRYNTAILIIDVGKRWIRTRQGSRADEKESVIKKKKISYQM